MGLPEPNRCCQRSLSRQFLRGAVRNPGTANMTAKGLRATVNVGLVLFASALASSWENDLTVCMAVADN